MMRALACLAALLLAGCFDPYARPSNYRDPCGDAAKWHADREAYWATVNWTRSDWHRDQRHRFEHAGEIYATCEWWNQTVPWGSPA